MNKKQSNKLTIRKLIQKSNMFNYIQLSEVTLFQQENADLQGFSN